MSKTYKKSPLIEAVCEFRFVVGNDFVEQQREVFYERVKNIFPDHKKEKKHQLEFEIRQDKTPEENKSAIKPSSHEFDIYFSEDKKYSVQLDRSRVSIHRVKPYTSWNEFVPLIQQVYKAYIEIFSPNKLERIGMRYINEVVIPIEDFLFTEYFTINASLPSLNQVQQKSIFLGSVFEQEDGRDAIKVQFTEKQSKKPAGMRTFMLDFDYFLVNPIVSFEEISEWLEKAHTNLEKVFEGVITNETRKLFS